MDDVIKMGIIDYMNLMFGVGEETTDFWCNLILPYCHSYYYRFPIEDLMNHYRANFIGDSINMNSLYFAFISLFGIKILSPPEP